MWNLIRYTVSGTNFMYIVLVFQAIEAYYLRIIPPVLFVSKWPYWPLNSKLLAFYSKNKWFFAWNVEFRVLKLFVKSVFFSFATLFLYLYMVTGLSRWTTFGDKGVKKLAELFLNPKLLRYARNFQWVQNSFFLNEKQIHTNSLIHS